MRPQTHRANEWDESVTSFCVCRGIYTPLTTQESVLLVHNISDADMARAKGKIVEPDKDGKERDKPAGFGLPGGGMKGEDFESPEEAARNELLGETGVRTLTVKHLLTEYKGLPVNKHGEVAGKPFYFEKGARPSVELRRGDRIIENPVHLFETKIEWEGSRLQKIFMESKKDLLSQFPDEDLERNGICVWLDEIDHILERLGVDLSIGVDKFIAHKEIVKTSEKVRSRTRAALYLGIEEFDEIDGLAIIPIKTLLGDIYHEERRKPQGQRPFYTSHLRRLKKGLEQKGCLDDIMSAI